MLRINKKLAWLKMLSLTILLCTLARADEYRSHWPEGTTRMWIGPEYWANRMYDWRLRSGRIECLTGDKRKTLRMKDPDRLPVRTVHLLTHRLAAGDGGFTISVRTGNLHIWVPTSSNAWSGFLVGAGQGKLDYRAAAFIHHHSGEGGGIMAVLDNEGRAVFRDMSDEETRDVYPVLAEGELWRGKPYRRGSWEEMELMLQADKQDDAYRLTLTAKDILRNRVISTAVLEDVLEERLRGNLALVSHTGEGTGDTRFWFSDFHVRGDKIKAYPDDTFGPILNALYAMNQGVLKLTAQFPPLGFGDARTAQLWTSSNQDGWILRGTSEIEYPGYVARFRVTGWDDTRDHDYQIRYENHGKQYVYDGRIRKDPKNKDEIIIAAFTGNQFAARAPDSSWGGYPAFRSSAGRYTPENFWFPHTKMIANIPRHNTDLLVFTGDQIYESSCPTESYRDEKNPETDYLYKWFVWCWAYNLITRSTPSIVLIDDHDVWQGNIWGEGGMQTPSYYHDEGGYKWSPVFQRMVVRTQCSHNPDPYDPRPLKHGRVSYFNTFRYGGIGFVVLEDRTFKSAPKVLMPRRHFHGGFARRRIDDISQTDVPGAKLLGQAQLKMLKEWVGDWTAEKMKVCLTQTVFSGVSTELDGTPAQDFDCNGWPPSGRNRALRVLREGNVFLIGGDQHLASIVQFGIDDFRDGPFQFGVPAVANRYRRWWLPKEPGANREPGMPDYAGDFLDGFLNKVTVYAVANSKVAPPEILAELRREDPKVHPQAYHHISVRELNCDGYGIVRLCKPGQSITMECWPWNADLFDPDNQFTGWPMTIHMTDNDGRKPAGYLPKLQITGLSDPVVQVVDEKTNEILYTTRARNGRFQPKVFAEGSYTVRVFEPGTERERVFKGQRIARDDVILQVEL